MIQVVSPATLEHVESMRGKIRAADVEEHDALFMRDIMETLSIGVRDSTKSWAGLIDGEVVCVCGVAEASDKSGSGVVWLTGTDLIDEAPIEFLRLSKLVLAEMLEIYEHLWNYADYRHTKALLWLQWLGFDIYEPIPLPPYGFAFHFFELRRSSCANP
jgi:hypothetical protein